MPLCYKIFKEKDHVDGFMKGNIYFSAAGRFMNERDNQRQYSEGTVPIYTHPCYIENIQVPNPYYQSYDETLRVPLFCCSSINQNNAVYDEGKLTILIPPENKILGRHMVYFDTDELFRLISEGVKEDNWGIRGEKIFYYDFDKLKDDSWLSKIHNFVDPLFIHDAKHNNQNEFRFVLTNKLLPKGAIDLTLRCGEWHSKPQYIELA